MNMIYTKKIALSLCLAALPVTFTACGENAIEAQDDFEFEVFSKADSLDLMEQRLANVDAYKCRQTYNKTRCETFVNEDGSYDIEKLADTENYDDEGKFIGSSSSAPESSSSDGNPSGAESSSSAPEKYLIVNKALNFTLETFKQTAKFMSESDSVVDPEVKFMVKTYSDDELVNTQVTAMLLDTTNVKEWKGTKSAITIIPRGIDKIELCPMVVDEDEFEDIPLSDGKCLEVKDLGLIEDNDETMQETKGEKFQMGWKWYLYDPETK